VHVLYHLARRPEAELKLRIADVVGKTIRDLRAPADRGVNRATLSFRRGRYIAPGSYVVELRIGKLVLKRPLTIPKLPSTRSQRPGEDKTVPEQIE